LKIELFLVQTITIGHRIHKAEKSFIGARQLAMEFTLVTTFTCCKPQLVMFFCNKFVWFMIEGG